MKRTPVESSNIRSVGYNLKTKTLEVQFLSGGIYQYTGVQPHLYEEFMAAPSLGSFFHRRIKNAFPFRRVR